MRLPLQIALLAIALATAVVPAQLGAGYSAAYANATISKVSAYVESVNESGYLAFYPNLTQAYSYLAKAEAAYNKSPDAAVAYANEAQSSAMAQYSAMGRYREVSFAVMAVLAVLSSAAVLLSMRKAKEPKSTQRRKR
jgi:hypothetical protein